MTDSPTRKRKTKKKLNWKKVATSLVVVILIVCLGMGCFFAWSVHKETDDFSAKKLLSGEAVSYTHLDVYKRQFIFIPL